MSLSEEQRKDLVSLYWEKYQETWMELDCLLRLANGIWQLIGYIMRYFMQYQLCLLRMVIR